MSLTRTKRKRSEQDETPPRDHALADKSSHQELFSDEDAEGSAPEVVKRVRRNVSKNLRQHGFLGGTYVGELYRSNMFKLQVDALLAQLKPNLSLLENTINNVLRDLKSFIESIPEREPLLVCNMIVSNANFLER
jgi:U3 small nucleolar RNA-associated protein 22